MRILQAECEAAGLDVAEVARIARRLEAVARDAERIGLVIFGGSQGSLRFDDGDGRLVCAVIQAGAWDGGDGAMRQRADGLTRGEE